MLVSSPPSASLTSQSTAPAQILITTTKSSMFQLLRRYAVFSVTSPSEMIRQTISTEKMKESTWSIQRSMSAVAGASVLVGVSIARITTLIRMQVSSSASVYLWLSRSLSRCRIGLSSGRQNSARPLTTNSGCRVSGALGEVLSGGSSASAGASSRDSGFAVALATIASTNAVWPPASPWYGRARRSSASRRAALPRYRLWIWTAAAPASRASAASIGAGARAAAPARARAGVADACQLCLCPSGLVCV